MTAQSNHLWIESMQQSKYADYDADTYNIGPLIDELESRIAALLDKPTAQFYTKGTTCQLAALKVHCDTKNKYKVLLHPQSHIAIDEQDAYQSLMGLKGVLIGRTDQPILYDDLKSADFNPNEVACLVIELPLRRAGFKLPEWQDLVQIKQWCDEHQIIMHLDGARIWESAHFYQKSWSEIAELFDSVYVSLYKGLGGLSGAVLTGETNFLKRCVPWRNRLGSCMWSSFPYLITALEGLDNNLNQINSWVIRAKEIAQALKKVPGLILDTPQTNGFQIRIKADLSQINNRLEAIINQLNFSPCKPFSSIEKSNLLFTEINVGSNHLDIKNEELVQFFTLLTKNL